MSGNIPMWGESNWANWKQSPDGPQLPFANEIHKINRVIRILELPCSPTPMMFLETAFPAIIKAVATLAEPDIKEAFKIKQGIADYGKHGRSLLKTAKDMINEDEDLGPVLKDGLKRFGVPLLELADKAAWWLFLIGIGIDLAVDWTNAAYTMAGCINQPAYQFTGTDPGAPVWVVTGLGHGPAQIHGADNLGQTGTLDGLFVPAGCVGYASCTGTCEPYIGQSKKNYFMRIFDSISGDILDQGAPVASDNTDGNTSISFTTALARRPTGYGMQMQICTDDSTGWECTPTAATCTLGYFASGS